jgi:nucleoid-associated protein YgaU
MYIKNPVRRAVAAAVLATSAAIAVGAVGAARADSTVTPDTGSSAVAPASPPGSRADDKARNAGEVVTDVDRHEVAAGESFWSIAEGQLPAGATAHEVSTLTKALMADNAPRLGYGDPAMLKPGDVVDIVPAPSEPAPESFEATVAPDSYDVVTGDSYWAIAESILGDAASPADVLEKTDELIEINSTRLGYEDPQMLHPGDVVFLQDVTSTTYAPATSTAPVKSGKTTGSTTPSTKPLARGDAAARRPTPTSPPLSEIALIIWETISPLQPATPPRAVADKPTRHGHDDIPRRGDRLSAPLSPAAPLHASAS